LWSLSRRNGTLKPAPPGLLRGDDRGVIREK